MIDRVLQDVRQAARALRQQPLFALVATVCLAIGISVNTAAFSLINAIVFRDFPGVERQSELAGVFIGYTTEEGGTRIGRATSADWEALKTGVAAFSGIAAYGNAQLSMRAGGEARALRGALISRTYFDVLGTRPAIGRFMSASATDPDDVVVISHALWMREFKGRPDTLGQPIWIGTHHFTIIGVTPEGFFGIYPADVIDPDFGSPEVFLPLTAAPFVREAVSDGGSMQIFGRLRAGVTVAQAEAQSSALASQLAATYPRERKDAFVVVRSGLGLAPENTEILTGLLFAMAVPALILLVSCANLANQLAARGIQRRREIAVRLSIGAQRSRVVSHLLAEALLIALAAAGVGVLLARWLLDAVRAWYLPTPFVVAIDVRVVVFTIGVALATAVAFGLLPALGATRPDLTGALKDGGSSGYRRSRTRSALVVVQIAASLSMIAVASVFSRVAEPAASPLVEALAGRSLMLSIDLGLLDVDPAEGRAFQGALIDRLRQLPGIESVAMAPFSIFELMPSTVIEPGASGRPRYLKVQEVTGDWFNATNTRVIRGRQFSAAEQAGPPSVAIVNEATAQYLWRNEDPIGKSLRIGDADEAAIVTVIGITPSVKLLGFRQPEALMIVPGATRYHPRAHFYLRTSVDADAVVASVRESVRALDARVPIVSLRTLEDAAAFESAPLTSVSSALGSLGAIAIGLAALGLFGVLAFTVAQRRYEIGVRLALGAQRRDVVWMIVRHALGLGATGVVAGTLVMIAVIAVLRSIIWGLEPLSMSTFATVAFTTLVVVLGASAIPARRAASVDPVQSLRAE